MPWVRPFIILLLLMGLVTPGQAQLSDIYANLSKKTYEAFNGPCPAISPHDFMDAKLCHLTSSRMNGAEDLESIAESVFLTNEASEEVQRLNCAVRKASAVSHDSAVKDVIFADMAQKVQAGVGVYKALIRARAALFLQREKTNQLRPVGTQTKASDMFVAESANLARKESEVSELEGILAALIQSTWNGQTRTMNDALLELIKAGDTDVSRIKAKLSRDGLTLMNSVQEELKDDRDVLLAQAPKTHTRVSTWNLNSETKRRLLIRAQQNNSFAKNLSDSPNLARGVECRLEAKYGKGQDYLDNIVFAGSMLAVGGAAVMDTASILLKSTLAVGTKTGRIAEHASKVFLYASLGLTSANVIKQVDQRCLPEAKIGALPQNICSGDDTQLIASEINSLDQGNCVLTVLLAASPLPILTGVSKALSGLTNRTAMLAGDLRNALAERGLASGGGVPRDPRALRSLDAHAISEHGSAANLRDGISEVVSVEPGKPETSQPARGKFNDARRTDLMKKVSFQSAQLVTLCESSVAHEPCRITSADLSKRLDGAGVRTITVTKDSHSHLRIPDFYGTGEDLIIDPTYRNLSDAKFKSLDPKVFVGREQELIKLLETRGAKDATSYFKSQNPASSGSRGK